MTRDNAVGTLRITILDPAFGSIRFEDSRALFGLLISSIQAVTWVGTCVPLSAFKLYHLQLVNTPTVGQRAEPGHGVKTPKEEEVVEFFLYIAF
jgi:hypothetical protein